MKKAIFILLACVTLSLSGQEPLHKKYLGKIYPDTTMFDTIEGRVFASRLSSGPQSLIFSATIYPSDSTHVRYYCTKAVVDILIKYIETTTNTKMIWKETNYHNEVGRYSTTSDTKEYDIYVEKIKNDNWLIYLSISCPFDNDYGPYLVHKGKKVFWWL